MWPTQSISIPSTPSLSRKTVAVIGATERAHHVGSTILSNLMESGSQLKIFPVNPKRESVLGLKAYPSVGDIPAQVDLAVIVTPAKVVPAVIRECVAVGIQGAIIISAGFKEIGPTGTALEQEILAEARKGGMRIIGPNCLGVMAPYSGLNATFARGMVRRGKVALISQSGAFCTSILDWSMQEQVGFSAFISVGSMLDVDWGDLINYIGKDYHTQSIVIYMESIGNARSFLSAARKVALTKPIIVLKAGRTEAAAKAATSHTGSLTGSDDVLDAAFQRSGVLRVNEISNLFEMAEVLGKQPRPRGPRLTIVTNAGGPGVLATDSLIESGGQLAKLSPDKLDVLNSVLPRHWSNANPIDIIGDADPTRFVNTVNALADDPDSDGMLIVLTPQDMTDPTRTAQLISENDKLRNKPMLTSWMGGEEVAGGKAVLNRARIPTFDYPDDAARAFGYMWQYQQNLQSLYETPTISDETEQTAYKRDNVREILAAARREERTILSEYESKQVLEGYNIHTVPTYLARTADEAVSQAEQIGYPVVLKLHSHTITHKSDVGGVRLNIPDAESVRRIYGEIEAAVAAYGSASDFLGATVQPMLKLDDGYELILGSSIDPQFGPVLLFGLGGTLVEVFRDSALGLPPLNSVLAQRMIEQTRISRAFKGVRGRAPVNETEVEQIMVRFSHLVAEQPWIKELDINPLVASPEQVIALDARVVLHPATMPEAELPQLAIRPYPTQYIEPWTLKNGDDVIIRPIRAEDEPLMVKLHQTLTEESVYARFFRYMPLNRRIAHDRMIQVCFVDYDDELAVVVERDDPATGEPALLGVGRLIKLIDGGVEFAVLVGDGWQGQGIGSKLMETLVEIARAEGRARIIGTILAENHGMQRVCQKLGFSFTRDTEDNTLYAELPLTS